MKRKFLALLLGAAVLSSVSYAQPPGNATSGITIVSGAGSLTTNGWISLNAVISYQGQLFNIVPVPDTQFSGVLPEFQEQQLSQAFINSGIVVDFNGSMSNSVNPGSMYGDETQANGDRYFGFDLIQGQVNYTWNAIPFDFGLSAVLGAGAIAAVKRARSRRKQLAVVA